MTAAAVAASQGLKVLLVEKTEHVGGTTAWSGGMVWVPANHQMRSAGLSDDVSLAEAYLDSTVPEADGADLRKTFLARGPEAIDYLEAHTKVRLQPVKVYPDYYPELPGATAGGRVLEPIAFDGLKLGHNFERLRPPLPEFTLFGGMMVNRLDIPHLRQAGRSCGRHCEPFGSFANIRCRGCVRRVARRCIWEMRSPHVSMLHCSRVTSKSSSARRSRA